MLGHAVFLFSAEAFLTALCNGMCKLEVRATGEQPVLPSGHPREPIVRSLASPNHACGFS